MLFFCNEVYANIDPDTTDKTVEILQSDFPQIHILYQDKSLGDSDYDHRGPTDALSMHLNNTKFMKEYVNEGQWVMFMAGDERFHPDQMEMIIEYIEFAQYAGRDGVNFIVMYEFINDTEYVNFKLVTAIQQEKFFRKGKEWIQHPQPHSLRTGSPKNPINIDIPIYHYPNHRSDNKFSGCWVYQGYNNTYDLLREQFGTIPTLTCPLLIPNWRELPELNNEGEFI